MIGRHRSLADHHRQPALGLGIDLEVAGQAGRGIRVDQQDPLTKVSQDGAEIGGCGRLADATLGGNNRDDDHDATLAMRLAAPEARSPHAAHAA